MLGRAAAPNGLARLVLRRRMASPSAAAVWRWRRFCSSSKDDSVLDESRDTEENGSVDVVSSEVSAYEAAYHMHVNELRHPIISARPNTPSIPPGAAKAPRVAARPPLGPRLASAKAAEARRRTQLLRAVRAVSPADMGELAPEAQAVVSSVQGAQAEKEARLERNEVEGLMPTFAATSIDEDALTKARESGADLTSPKLAERLHKRPNVEVVQATLAKAQPPAPTIMEEGRFDPSTGATSHEQQVDPMVRAPDRAQRLVASMRRHVLRSGLGPEDVAQVKQVTRRVLQAMQDGLEPAEKDMQALEALTETEDDRTDEWNEGDHVDSDHPLAEYLEEPQYYLDAVEAEKARMRNSIPMTPDGVEAEDRYESMAAAREAIEAGRLKYEHVKPSVDSMPLPFLTPEGIDPTREHLDVTRSHGARVGKSRHTGCNPCFCHDKSAPPVEPMNVPLLLSYMNSFGRIMPRSGTFLCAKMQRRVAKMIRRARHLGLFTHYKSMFIVHNPFEPPVDKDWRKDRRHASMYKLVQDTQPQANVEHSHSHGFGSLPQQPRERHASKPQAST